jgi:hypothetical protein
MTVGLCFQHAFGPDIAARSGPILDDHRLAELILELLRNHSRQNVVHATGGIGDDNLNGLCRKRLSLGDRRQRRRAHQSESERPSFNCRSLHAPSHVVSSPDASCFFAS